MFTDKSPPPNSQTSLGDPAKTFQGAMGILLWLTNSCAAFWALTMRKWGTVGTRTYGWPLLGCVGIMAVMCAGTQLTIDGILFQGAVWFLFVMMFFQLASTNRKRRKGTHVHSWHIGIPRYGRGNPGYLLEVVLGIGVGAAFIMLEAQYFGGFIICSAVCCGIDLAMLETRDQIRTFQLRDAEMDQRRMIDLYERQ